MQLTIVRYILRGYAKCLPNEAMPKQPEAAFRQTLMHYLRYRPDTYCNTYVGTILGRNELTINL